METVIIEAISGNAWVRDSNGNIRELREGDIVQPGETIITDANASVIVSTPQGVALQLPSGSELSHADIVLHSPEPDESMRFSEAEKASKAEVQLEEQFIAQLDNNPPSQGSSSAPIISKDGLTFVMLERIELPLPPLAYAYNYERGDEPLYRLNGWEGTSESFEPITSALEVRVELEGANDDGIYSQDEIGEDGTVTAQVTLGEGTQVGDTLIVTDKDGNELLNRPVTQDDLDNGVTVEVPVAEGDTDVSVSATVTDPAGNSSSDDDSKPIEPVDNTSPAVSVELTGSGGDGTYSQEEIGDDGTVTAQVTLEDGTEVGDTLVVTDKDGNVLFDGEVTQDDLDNGVSVEVPVSPGDTDVSVTATVTDPAGNSSSDDDSKPIEPVDNTSPAVSVELTGSGGDGTYSQEEIGDDGTVTAQVTLQDGTEVGDTLVVTDKDGNVLFDGEVTQDDLDNGVTVEVPVTEGDTDVSVTATVTDPAGNSSSDSDTKPVANDEPPQDNESPEVSVELIGSGDDGTYSQDEIGEDGTVTAQVTLEDGTQVGDTLVVTDKDGNELLNRPITQDDLDNGVTVEVPVAEGDTDVSVTATVTDPAGNSSSDDDSKPIEPIDDVPPTVSVELTGSGDDGIYSQDEIGDDGTVTAQVTLQDGTEVGDTLIVTDKDGNELLNRPVTQDDLDNGVTVEVPVAEGDTDVSVTATVTDPAGNSSSDDDSKPIEPIDDVPPTVSVELTGSGDDGIYSQDEIGDDGTVTAQVTLEEGTEVGDTLVVTDKDGNVLDEREVTQDDLDNGVTVEVPVAEGDTDVSVTATVTDPAGNSSSDDDSKPIEPIDDVPPAVTVELTGSGDDGIYSQDEIGDDGTVTADVTLQDGTEVGDTLVVTDKDGNVLFDGEVTQDDLDNGVTVEVPVAEGDTEVSVTATVTDPAGNSSSDDDSKPIEPIDDVPPTVSVELTGSGDDGTYSQDEIGDDGTVTAQVTLEDGTEVGDTLVVTDKDGNVLFDGEVTQDDLDNGVTVEVPVAEGDTDVSVTATVTDPAGNSSSDDDSKPIEPMDDVPPTVSVELTGSGDDGTYSQDEIGDDGTVTADVTLQDGTEVGDTLIVTDKDGNELVNRPVTQDDLDNGVTVEVPVAEGDTDVSVTATVTDPAGNTSSDDDSKPIEPTDDVPPAVTVELTGSGDDGTYSQDEIGDDGTVTAQVTLQDGTEVGDTLVVTDKDGNELVNRPVTQDDLDNGVSVEVPVAEGDTDVSVTATVTDPAGNSSSDDDSKPIEPIDDVPPAVTVELTGSGDDGTYSQDEIGDDGTVTADVTLQDGTEVGDTLIVTDKDGNELVNRPVTQDDLDNGVTVEVPVAPGDTDVSVTATVTDPAGNTASDDDEKPVDNVPPAVTVELTGSGDDGIYSQDEIGDDGTVTADVTLQDGTEVGDTLVVTDKDGNVLDEREVTQDDLDNGVSVEVPVAPGDTDVSVTATVTDPAGNTASDDDKKPVDNVPPAVTVELTGSGDDGTYSQDEIGDDGTVTAQVTLQDGTEVGDTLIVTDKDGNELLNRLVTQDDLDNGVSVEVPVAPGDTDVSVTATVTDPAGNTASDDDEKPVDNVPPAVTVELTGSGDDGTYSQDEIGDDGTVTAQVTLQDGTEVGDTLIVTDKDGNELLNRPVTQDDLDNGVSVEVPVAEGDTDVSVTATVTDPAGNTASDDDQKPVDNVPPAVTVELTGSGDDGTYSQDEIGDDGTVTADVTLQDGTEVGDTLIVTDKDGNELLNRPVTQDDLDNGVSVEVPVSPGDTDVSVTATVTDPAGNTASDDDQKPVDNVPPAVSVELTGSGDDGTYSQDEIGDDGTVTAQVTLQDGTEVGDTLVVTDKDGNELLNRPVTQDDLDNGVTVEVPVAEGDTDVSVTATVTDPAGNTASDDDEKPVDNVPPAVTVELTGSGDDGTYSQDEIGDDGTVTADVTLQDGTEVGDTLVVTDKNGNILDERTVTQDDLDNGVTVEVPVAPGDTDVSVTATVTDPAGNTASDDDEKPVDNVPPAVTVELTGSGDDGTYSQDEIGDDGTVTAQVTLQDGTEVGDTLVVTDKDGNVLDERTVTQDDLDNGVSVEVPVSPGDTDVSVIATVTDPAGNTASDDDKKLVDSVPPAVTVELIGSGDDGTYSQDEIGDDGTVTADVTLEEGTEVGDTLIVTDKDGNELLNRPVTQDDLDNGVSVEVPVAEGDTDVSVTATVTDPTGNTASDDDQKPVDNVPPAVSVELTGSGDDGTYSQDEIGDDGTVTADVTLQDGTEVGDTLVVTDKDGNELLNRPVTQDDLDNGVSVEVPVSPGDTDVSVTATVTDPAGNTASDDDQKPVDWDVSVNVPNNNDATTPDGDITDQVVFESGLADGSAPNTNDTRVESSLTLTAPDGLRDTGAVTLAYTDENGDPATLELSKAQVEALGSDPQTLTTQYGELTLNGYSQAADGTITLDYSYELTTAPSENLNDLMDRITVTASDRDGQTDSGDLNIKIVDDAPVAEDDTNAVTEDSALTTTGNVLGDSGASPGDVADTQGADGATVTGVASDNVPGNDATDSGGTLVIEGEYGTLMIDADGSYTYTLDNANLEVQGLSDGDQLEEVFSYTLTDGDSDTDDATLTITVNGSDDGVIVDVPNNNDATTPDGNITDQVVFESGLADGSAPNADDIRVESSLTLTALDGLRDTGAVTLAYTDENGDPATLELSKAQVEALGDTPQSLTTQYGELTLNGYSQAADGTITLDYDYLLTNAPEEDVDSLMDSIKVTATDKDGSTDNGDLNIKIVDDAPTAEDDTNAVTEGADTSGNVIGGDGVSPGDVADTEGADGVTVFAVTSNNVPSNTADETNGTLVIEGEYGTLTLNADGSYTYVADPNSTNADVQDVFTYTVRDGDGDESTATLTIDVTDVTGTPTDTTGSVDEAGLVDGTDASADSEIISGADLNLQDGWTVESAQSGSTPWGSWTVNTDGTFDYTLNSEVDHSGTPPTDSFEYTAVDQYGNTVTNTVTINIVDDQPVISVDSGQLGSVEVDESDFSTGEVSANDADFIDGVFAIDHGADGEDSTTYRLQVTDGVASGVTDTATGEAVHIFMDGDDVVGRVGNDPTGEIAFRIELDGDSGAVTLTQTRPLEHSDSSDHEDVITLNDGALQLVATAVDGDGDSVDSDAVDVGGQFTFRDDGPAITTPPSSASVDEANLALGSNPDVPATTVSDTFAVDFGTDGAGDVQFSEGGVDSTVSALEAAELTSNGQDLEYVVSNDGHTLTGYRGADRSESGKVFTVEILNPTAATPGYEFTLHRPLDHDGGVETLNINLQHLTVTDGDNDTVETDFTITVFDDDPSVEPKAITVEEDSDVGSTENTFNTNADATGTNTGIDGGTPDADGWVETAYGKAKVNDDGTITYEPNEHYSGEDSFTYTTTTDNETKTFTVNVTVNPVADAPDLQGGNVQTDEDTAVALNLTAPNPVDTMDQNGAGTAGDNPELLSEITLSGIPSGTELLDGSGNLLWKSDSSNGGSLTIVLSDGAHIDGATGDLIMTTAQYQALQVNPVAQSHENFTVDVSVTSYEVDDSGNPLNGVNGAESTAQVEVGVQAVTDDVDLTIDGGDTHTASVDEDGALDLGNLLGASFEDLDGSEERWLEISDVPEGTSVTVNGSTITAGADGKIVIPASDLGDFGAGTSTQIPSSLVLTPPADFSGDLDGITVTLKAQDHDSDAGDNNGEVKEDSVTLNIDTLPVADKPADISAVGPEDSEIAFLADLDVSDTDGSETIMSISIDSVPDGWVIKDGDGTVLHTGNGSDGFTIGPDDVADGSYTGYTVTPPAHSSVDESLSLQVTVGDTASTGSDIQTHNVTADIAVTPVAEEVGGDSDGDSTDDLTMNGNHTYGTGVEGVEDEWFALNADGFNPADGWANQDADGSEQTFALLTPELVSGLGGSADGSSFRYSTDGGTTWVEQTYNGSPIEVPVEYLDTLEFRAAPNQKGEFRIRVEVKTVDTDDEGNTDTAISGEAILDGIFIDTPVADLASLNVSSPAEGNEDEPIALDIRPQSSDPNESFTVTLSGAPAGAVITYGPAGSEQTWTSTGESDTFEIEDFDRNAPLTVTPPQDSNKDFTLTASVVTVDEYGVESDTLATPVEKSINVHVDGVADAPDVTTETPVYAEEDLDDGSASVTLSDIITATSGEQTGDGSEMLTYRITGLDDQFDVEGATLIRGEGAERVWVATDPNAVTITAPENFSGQVDFSVTPIVTEDDGDTLESAEQQVSFQVTPSPEAGFSIQSSLAEDQLGQLNLSFEPQNGDTNESLNSVWIEVASVTGNQFELYYGSDGSTTLAEAAANDEPGVVEEGGYYKLTGGAWNNIYAQGDEHFSGSAGTLKVQYEITDTPNAGYEGTVGDTTVPMGPITHEVIIEAVTDMPTVTITGIENVGSSDAVIDEPAKDVTADGNDRVEVTVDITQPDTDGSESLKYLLIDNVPAGVSVVGGEFVGQVAGGTGSQWRIEIDPDVAFNGTDTLTQTVEFTMGDGTQVDAIENHEITITAVTQDNGATSQEERGSDSWTLTGEGDFGNGEDPNEIINWEDAGATMTEDAPWSLSDLVNAQIGDTSDGRSAVTISDLPPGAVVNGMQQTTIDGELVWYASTEDGSNAGLQALLDGITVTPPANWNDTDGEFSFDTTLTTQAPSGEENSETISVTPPVTPVTDEPTVNVSAGDAVSGEDIDFTIDVSSPADNPDVSLVDGQLVISLDETGMTSGEGAPGSLWYNGEEITPDGDGNYVIAGVSVGDSVTVSYRPGGTIPGATFRLSPRRRPRRLVRAMSKHRPGRVLPRSRHRHRKSLPAMPSAPRTNWSNCSWAFRCRMPLRALMPCC